MTRRGQFRMSLDTPQPMMTTPPCGYACTAWSASRRFGYRPQLILLQRKCLELNLKKLFWLYRKERL